MLEKREFDRSDFFWRVSTTITIVAGFFSVVIFTLLLVNYIQIKRLDPVNHELLTMMRQEYANASEKSAELAERIRALDLMTRKAFFTSQTHLRIGAWMLLGSVTIFLIAFKNMMRWRPELPELAEVPTADKEFLAYAQSRHLITWAGIGLLAGGMMTSYFSESALTAELLAVDAPESGSDGDSSAAPEIPVPTWDEMAVNWPSFRGPGALGVAHFSTAPVNWDLEGGSNVKWSADLAVPGNNSPVVWGDRLYVASANEETREVTSYDTETGDVVWSKAIAPLPTSPREELEVMEDTGYAPSTMVVHGSLVFALFPNGDVIALDPDGNQQWGVSLGIPDNHYGHSSSLLAFDRVLFVQYDQATDARLLGLDIATGKETWKVERDEMSWASPILAPTSFGNQLVVASESKAEAYAPLTGTLLWSADCLGGEVSPSPAYANGMVFVANEYAVAAGIALEGTADAITANVAWEYDTLLPEVSSPVGDGERFYYGTAVGDIVCLDAKTGEELWAEETEDGFYSSPILVGDRIYIADLSGNMYVFKTGNTYEELARFSVGEAAFATPAFLDGRVYVRTPEKLYCIEAS